MTSLVDHELDRLRHERDEARQRNKELEEALRQVFNMASSWEDERFRRIAMEALNPKPCGGGGC